MFVSAEPELAPSVSLRGFFLEVPASLLVDFRTTVLGLACVGVPYPPSGVARLALDAVLDGLPLKL